MRASDSSDSSQDKHPSAQQKKKRTRTLTTPHQSAVLHALLAKSRFPTTAMREEVGRQIGLSARKVQIWFQNQRQKARRPQSDSGPLTRPPQFGPFPIMTSAGPSSSTAAPTSAHSPYDSADSNPVLSLPAISTWSSRPEDHEPPRRPGSPLPQRIPAHSRGLSLSPTSPHFSAVLPPINLGAESYVSATSSFPPPRSFVNSSPLEHGSPAIPPPFVLQPQPQWDPQTFTPYTRPQFASWLHSPGSPRTPIGPHDRVMHPLSPDMSRPRHVFPPLREPHPPPSRNQRFAPSRASLSTRRHARSDDEE